VRVCIIANPKQTDQYYGILVVSLPLYG